MPPDWPPTARELPSGVNAAERATVPVIRALRTCKEAEKPQEAKIEAANDGTTSYSRANQTPTALQNNWPRLTC